MTLLYRHLEGREFVLGYQDCLDLVIRFFWDNWQIPIRNYARPSGWSSDTLDLIQMFHEREGFELIAEWKAKDLRPGDILCCAIGETRPNHLAIYLGNNELIDHLAGRASRVEPYRDFWRRATCYLIRHPDVPDLRPTPPDGNLSEILRDRYRLQPA